MLKRCKEKHLTLQATTPDFGAKSGSFLCKRIHHPLLKHATSWWSARALRVLLRQ
jgi:hypothetical protein